MDGEEIQPKCSAYYDTLCKVVKDCNEGKLILDEQSVIEDLLAMDSCFGNPEHKVYKSNMNQGMIKS